MRTLLLTRPRAQSEDFAAELDAHVPGRFRTVISPLQEIEFRPSPVDLEGVTALAFTSVNGVKAYTAVSSDRTRPAYCVGARTADAAEAAGFTAHSAGGTIIELGNLLTRDAPSVVLHVRGFHVATRMSSLVPERVTIREHVGYVQRDVPPDPAVAALGASGQLDVVAVFSPRSARLLRQAGACWKWHGTTIVSISTAVNKVLSDLCPSRFVIASHPSRHGMLDALAGL